MLYGSIASTVTLRFFKYFSSILYGCLAPVVRSSIITSTGPFELSGAAAGVSVEGPMASVSARFRLVGGAGFTGDDAGSVLSEGLISVADGVEKSVWTVMGVSDGCAVGIADAGVAADAWRVRISTGLDDSAS